MEKCLNCQFYDRRNARPTDGKATMWGQCRRHSPHLNPATAKSYHVEGVWPLVRDDDWCGEWRSPTRVSLARSRFAGRPVELVTTSASTSATTEPEPADATSAVAGDD